MKNFGLLAKCELLKTKSLLVVLEAFLLFIWVLGSASNVYGDVSALEALPAPFVSSGGLLNCTVVVASSSGHGPCGGAHTMDVMGAILIGTQLGLDAAVGVPSSALDDHISSYDYGTSQVTISSVGKNLIVVGGPGVNQVGWHYNNLRNSSGDRVLPVYFDKYANGTDYVYVVSSGRSYTIERDGAGKITADYGVITMYYEEGRSVLLSAGLGGSGTWASCKVLSSLEEWELHGDAVVIRYYDSNGDGLLDTISIVEEVFGSGFMLNSSGYLPLWMVLLPLLSKWRVLKQKIVGRQHFSKVYLLLFLFVASQLVMATVSSSPSFEVYTFKDFSHPFVSSGGLLNCTVVVASSSGHGPCGGAHTMDVMGAILIGTQLGLDAAVGVPSSALDDHISSYDYGTSQVTISSVGKNLIVVGGPGVNQVGWHYNNLRNSSGDRVLPVYFDKYANGTDYVYVVSSGRSYTIERDGAGKITADYGVVTLHYDSDLGFWVLIVAGLGGSGTLVSSRLLADYEYWSLFGRAAVIRFSDSNGDGNLDQVSLAESVGYGKSINVYWDEACSDPVEAIDWGVISPGERKNVTVYVRNEGESETVLSLGVGNWDPLAASDYLGVEWDYGGESLESGGMVAVTLSLVVDSDVVGITGFSVTISVDSS